MTISALLRNLGHFIDIHRPRLAHGYFFVDQLSDKELALFHDPDRP